MPSQPHSQPLERLNLLSAHLTAEEAPSPVTFKGGWLKLKLVKIEKLTRNTNRFTFELPSPNHVAGLPITSSLQIRYKTPDGQRIIRSYTPVSNLNEKGVIKLVVKWYIRGLMSTYLFSTRIGDYVDFCGPKKKFPWKENCLQRVALLGAGTGIAPLFQLIQGVLSNPRDKTIIELYYGNLSESDILLKEDLDLFSSTFPQQFKVTYFIDKPERKEEWKHEIGFITKQYLQEHLFPPSLGDSGKIFVCGPEPFQEAFLGDGSEEKPGILAELGYSEDQIYEF